MTSAFKMSAQVPMGSATSATPCTRLTANWSHKQRLTRPRAITAFPPETPQLARPPPVAHEALRPRPWRPAPAASWTRPRPSSLLQASSTRAPLSWPSDIKNWPRPPWTRAKTLSAWSPRTTRSVNVIEEQLGQLFFDNMMRLRS